MQLWDCLAGWYQVETGLNNFTLLALLEGQPSEFVVINHARWDGSLLSVILKQLCKKSFGSYGIGQPRRPSRWRNADLVSPRLTRLDVLNRPKRKDDKIFTHQGNIGTAVRSLRGRAYQATTWRRTSGERRQGR